VIEDGGCQLRAAGPGHENLPRVKDTLGISHKEGIQVMTTTTIYSTTGTAPIGIEVVHPTPGASNYDDGDPLVILTH